MAEERISRDEGIRKLGEMIQGIKVAMLTTQDKDGMLRSRPMMTQQTKFDGELWFFTGTSTAKVDELQQNQHVNVSYVEVEDQRYVSVSGRAELVHDRAKIDELWNPIYRAWFPNGPDDPDLALLKITIDQAEYWDAAASRIVQLAGFNRVGGN
jgi:general stress protein 26